METTAPTDTRTELPFAQHHAFIIGIDNYAQVSPLQTAVNDARKLAEVLAAQQHFHVHPPLLNAKGEAIRNLLKTLPEKVGADDRVLFYFAGHGIAADGDDGPAGYIVPADADPTEVKTFIPMEDLHQSLNALPCRHLLLILDCCFSGAFKWSSNFRAIGTLMPKRIYKERFDRFVQDPAWQVITSAACDQKALDVLRGDGLHGKVTGDRGIKKSANGAHSPFALALFEGLSGAADARIEQEGDGIITATELYSYIRDQIEPATIKESQKLRQTPGFFPLKKHDKGEFIFLHPRHRLNLPPIPRRNPYKGLQSFNEEDRELFYGRDRVIAELRAKAEENKLLVVSGASGCGKSSVIKAGLLPVLREEGFRILPVIRPGVNPVLRLERGLKSAELLSPRASLRKQVPGELLKKLRAGKTVLLIDQYEELLTRCSDEESRNQFIAVLKKLLEATAPENFKLIITVRADFETHFDQGELAKYWQPGRYTVPWFSVEELKEVIVMPTMQEVLIFDPAELVDEIINEVIQEPGALPLLSYTLSELYEAYVKSGRQDRALKKEDYDRLGGVMGALRTKADLLYQSLDTGQQRTMRKIMLRMVSSEGELAGRRVLMDELIYDDPAENQRVDTVIQKLVEARLVVKGQDTLREKEFVEPAHDALVRAWKTLLDWIQAVGKDKLALQDRLKEQVQEYERLKRDENVLWDNDPRLDLMKLELEDSARNWLNTKEGDFIKKSAEVKTRKLKRRQRLRIAITSSLSLLAIVAIGFAVRVSVLKYYDDNFSAAKRFEEAASVPIADQSGRELQKTWLYTLLALGEDVDKSKNLAVSAGRLIRQGVAAGMYQQLWSSPGALSDINDIAFSPDGKLLAIAGDDGNIRLCDLNTGAERHALTGHTQGVSAVAFSPDGRWLASASEDSTIRLWDIAAAISVRTLAPRGTVQSLAFHPNGKFLAAAQDRSIRIWNFNTRALADSLEDPEMEIVRRVVYSPDGRRLAAVAGALIRIWEVASHSTPYQLSGNAVAFSPNGETLASASKDGVIDIWDAKTGARLHTLTGHRGEIEQTAFSFPDGKWLASASEDSTIRIWDMTANALKQVLFHHGEMAQNVAFSPNRSNWLAAASADRNIRLWDIETGTELAALAGHRSKINGVVFSETDQLFASSSDDGAILLWDAATGRQLRRFEGHRGAVLSIDLREVADLLVSAGTDQTIRLWNIKNDSSKIFTGHRGAVNSIAIDPSPALTPAFIVSGSDDKTVRLWKIADGSFVELGKHNAGVKSVVIDRDGRRVASGASDGSICLWNIKDGKNELVRWYGHAKAINALAFNYDGSLLASASDDDEIRLWEVREKSPSFEFFKNNAGPLQVELSEVATLTLNERSIRDLKNDGLPPAVLGKLTSEEIRNQPIRGEAQFLEKVRAAIADEAVFAQYRALILRRASKTETAELMAYQTAGEATQKLTFLEILRGHEDNVLSVDFSEDGRLLASGSSDETIRLWEVNSASELAVLPGHQDDVHAVAFNHESPNAILASASGDKSIRLWDVEESCNLDHPLASDSPIRALSLSPDGQTLAAVGEDKFLRFWEIDAKRLDRAKNIFKMHGGWGVLLSATFSPDGEWLAYGGKDDVIRLLNVKSHQLISLAGNFGDGLSVAFHPRQPYLAAGSSDGKVRIWDLQSKKLLTTAEAHQDKVRSVVFSPEGQFLASAGSDKIVQLWRFDAGKLELWKTNDNHQSGVWSMAFSPDGNWLATGAWDNTIHLWNFQIDQTRQLRGHRGPVLTVKFSPDGTRLASGSWDHTIRLWEVKSGRELDVIQAHKAPVKSVVFHPNGKLLISGAEDKNIRLRDLSYLDAIALTAGDSLKALQIASADTSGRIRDFMYLASASFAQRHATHLPFQTAFQSYAYQLAYRLNAEQELLDEPLKFYLQAADGATANFAQQEFSKLRQPRPRHKGPIQWSLENISETEQTERRNATRWLSDMLKRITGLAPH